MQRHVVTLKLIDVSEVRTAYIIRAMMLAAVRTSETSVNFNTTIRRCIPEDSKLHIRHQLTSEGMLRHVLPCIRTINI
jgi:hypothetical protein